METPEERHHRDFDRNLSEDSGNTTRKVISLCCNDNAPTLGKEGVSFKRDCGAASVGEYNGVI